MRVPRCTTCGSERLLWTDGPFWICSRCGDEWCEDHHPMFAPPDVRVYAVVRFDGWAGVREERVEVVGETAKRYRVVALARMKWAGRSRYLEAGETALAPKDVLRFEEATT